MAWVKSVQDYKYSMVTSFQYNVFTLQIMCSNGISNSQKSEMQTNLLVWKSILFFAYKEISDIFTGLTYFLLAMAKGPISFHKLKSS